MIQALLGLQHSLKQAGDHLQSPLLLFVRLYWGWQFMQTGWGKLTHLDRFTHFFTTLGLPAAGPLAAFIGVLELTGGGLLAIGLFVRPIAVPLIVNMIVAYVLASWEALSSILTDPEKFYHADPFTFLCAALLVFAFGPGRISIDAYFESRRSALHVCVPTEAPIPAVRARI